MYSGAFCKTVHCQGPGLRTCDIPWGSVVCEGQLKFGEEIGCGDLGEATQCGDEDYNWVNLICEAPCEHGEMRQYGTKKWDANCAAQGPAHRCVDAKGECLCDPKLDYGVPITSDCGQEGCPPTQRRVYKKKNFDCRGQEEIFLDCTAEPPCVVSTQGGD